MLNQVLRKYLKLFPDDAAQLGLLISQVEAGEQLDDRRNFRGHIAGDALVLSPDLTKILFIYHLRSKNWQQPGGHWDAGEEGPWETAPREAAEETGVIISRRLSVSTDDRVPLHIITGPVYPSDKKKEPHHWHHDFRYGFIAKTEKLGEIADEGIGGAKWVALNEVAPNPNHNIQTSIARLRALL